MVTPKKTKKILNAPHVDKTAADVAVEKLDRETDDKKPEDASITDAEEPEELNKDDLINNRPSEDPDLCGTCDAAGIRTVLQKGQPKCLTCGSDLNWGA